MHLAQKQHFPPLFYETAKRFRNEERRGWPVPKHHLQVHFVCPRGVFNTVYGRTVRKITEVKDF